MVTTRVKNRTAKNRRGRKVLIPEAAMCLYSEGELRLVEIAERYGVSPSAISMRAKQLGLKPRARGRWRLGAPVGKQQQVLTLLAQNTQASVARRLGVTRQRIHQIVRRWPSHVSKQHVEDIEVVPPQREPHPHVISFRLSTKANTSLKWARKSLGLSALASRNQVARAIVNNFLMAHERNFNSTTVVKA